MDRSTRPAEKSAIVFFLTGCFLTMGMLAGPACRAQLSTTGTINGTVVDQSGAVIPAAKVVITETGTKTVTQTISNSAGNFAQVGLNSGHYEVTVSDPGFNTYRETNIYLGSMATYSVHALLKPGSVDTTVTVTGTQAQVQTTTAEISSTISGEEAQELPLNGQNFEQLGSLMPGVINSSPVATMGTGGYTTTNSLVVNGGSPLNPGGAGMEGTIYYLDGLMISSSVVHDENIITPSPELITEVKALQNNYSAQYSLIGASAVVVESKSGNEAFHGGAWEFLRNTDLNATRYFSQNPTDMNWHIFGYSLGGPLFIPHLYNQSPHKTFFYFNQQWVRQKAGVQALGQDATAAMRGQGTPGGQLLFPGTSASPVPGIGGPYGVAYLADPQLTAQGKVCSAKGKTGCFQQDANGNWIIPSSRVDKNALLLYNAVAPLPNLLGPGGYSATSPANDYLNADPNITNQVDLFGKVDHDLSSKLRLSGEYMVEEQTFKGANAARMGTPWNTDWDIFASDSQGFQLRLTQILSSSMTNQTSVGIGVFDATHDYGGIRMVSQVPGIQQTLPYSGVPYGNYLNSITMSQGWPKLGTATNYIVPRATEVHGTITDDWSWLHGKHFLQAGFTYFKLSERKWMFGVQPMGQFTFTGYATSNAMADYFLGLAATFQQGGTALRAFDHGVIVSPYVEETWKLLPRLTLSGGLRYEYMPWPSEQNGYMVDFDPARYNLANAPIVSPKGVLTPTPTFDPTNGLVLNGVNGVPSNLTNAVKNYWAPVFGFAWDVFGNGRSSLRGGWGLTYYATAGQGCATGGCFGYPTAQSVVLGTSNFDNPAGGATPATAPTESGVPLKDYRADKIYTYSLSWQQQIATNWIATIAGAGSMQRDGMDNVDINQPPPFSQNGVNYDFNPNLNSASYVAAYYAPYQGYGTMKYWENVGFANWNALEASLKHRAGKYLYLTAAYTWSHGLNNYGGFQNSRNLRADYGNSGEDHPHVFTVSGIYSLPTFQNGRLWRREILGGWRYSDMTTIQSGGTGSLSLSTSNKGLATEPVVIAPVTYPKKWRNTGDLWFSTSSFAAPAPGSFGNSGNGTIRQPGVIVFNMALYKTFPLSERVKLEFRSEFFNAFNHTNPDGPGLGLGTAKFGQVSGAKEAREGQGSLKLTF